MLRITLTFQIDDRKMRINKTIPKYFYMTNDENDADHSYK